MERVNDRRSKCCGNCVHRMENSTFYGGATCTNKDSPYHMQWVSEEHCCKQHEWRNDN